jgi:hypothetical protein
VGVWLDVVAVEHIGFSIAFNEITRSLGALVIACSNVAVTVIDISDEIAFVFYLACEATGIVVIDRRITCICECGIGADVLQWINREPTPERR